MAHGVESLFLQFRDSLAILGCAVLVGFHFHGIHQFARSVHHRADLGRAAFPPERLGRTPGRRDEPVPSRGRSLRYSPWCTPNNVAGVKCVIVNRDMQDAEPQAWDFVMNFARDNDLQIVDACLMPDAKPLS